MSDLKRIFSATINFERVSDATKTEPKRPFPRRLPISKLLSVQALFSLLPDREVSSLEIPIEDRCRFILNKDTRVLLILSKKVNTYIAELRAKLRAREHKKAGEMFELVVSRQTIDASRLEISITQMIQAVNL